MKESVDVSFRNTALTVLIYLFLVSNHSFISFSVVLEGFEGNTKLASFLLLQFQHWIIPAKCSSREWYNTNYTDITTTQCIWKSSML